MPHFILSGPHVTLEIPHRKRDLPCSTLSEPYGKRETSRGTIALPRGKRAVPRFMLAAPHVTLEMPRCMREVPYMKRAVRRGKRSAPHVQRAMPHGKLQMRCGTFAARGLRPPLAALVLGLACVNCSAEHIQDSCSLRLPLVSHRREFAEISCWSHCFMVCWCNWC